MPPPAMDIAKVPDTATNRIFFLKVDMYCSLYYGLRRCSLFVETYCSGCTPDRRRAPIRLTLPI
ncbi:hypothetical protein AFE_2683 [Acidithiobacillus ferrooxidans ATCC 23270]|uniref:Uncharacterized protein n=1 Tax=Acidithiobacillus ferrooxidans (strain ATCC 23270 / DSM 14882 / CIP 104768 / NCIMB 8455) TaxID=243159 RepID=B7J8B5_ACIF2|nr:hypothetical protein AFE_2683 [Acidithiobacillus ferrooxidans ATCC 23270]